MQSVQRTGSSDTLSVVQWSKDYIVFKRKETCALDCKYNTKGKKNDLVKMKPIQGNKLCAKQNVH